MSRLPRVRPGDILVAVMSGRRRARTAPERSPLEESSGPLGHRKRRLVSSRSAATGVDRCPIPPLPCAEGASLPHKPVSACSIPNGSALRARHLSWRRSLELDAGLRARRRRERPHRSNLRTHIPRTNVTPREGTLYSPGIFPAPATGRAALSAPRRPPPTAPPDGPPRRPPTAPQRQPGPGCREQAPVPGRPSRATRRAPRRPSRPSPPSRRRPPPWAPSRGS